MDHRSNINAKAKKLLEENTGEFLHDLEEGNDFLNRIAKALTIREK